MRTIAIFVALAFVMAADMPCAAQPADMIKCGTQTTCVTTTDESPVTTLPPATACAEMGGCY